MGLEGYYSGRGGRFVGAQETRRCKKKTIMRRVMLDGTLRGDQIVEVYSVPTPPTRMKKVQTLSDRVLPG